MNGTKIWRLSLTAILAFGWIFLTPAQGDDPLQIANQQIIQLEADVQKLTDQVKTQSLIDIANSKYDAAVTANNNLVNAQTAYNNALTSYNNAVTAKNDAQSAFDAQKIIRDNAYADLQTKQDALDIANINLSNTPAPTSGAQGVSFKIYPLSRNGNTAYLSPNAGLMCQGALPTFYTWNGDSRICYANQNIIGIFNATLTVPANVNDVYFAAYTDDGSKIYVNGVLEASQWREQGGTWGPYTRHFDTSVNKKLDLEIWWYNGGGPGIMTIGWGYNGIWTGIPQQYLSYGQGSSQEVIDAYNAAVAAQQTAQTNYDNALYTYNSASDTLIQLDQAKATANNNVDTANNNLNTASTNLQTAQTNYDNAIKDMQDAIVAAQNEYNKQAAFEEKQRVAAAMAQALANQPQPTPEPTIAPSPTPTVEPTTKPTVKPTPTPTPEQTKPSDPTPTPTPETKPSAEPTPTPEPKPTVEPSPTPSPQPTDITPTPTVEPTPNPSQTPDKTENAPVSAQMANLIADLTNSNTLTKLSPEQKIAVAGTLGIKPTEIAKVAELAKSDPNVGQALQEFGDRANANLNAPMPYTLADATTEVAAEKLLSDPIGALTNIDFKKVLSPSQWGKDMTDDQRKKAHEVIVPVIIASNLVAAAMTRRI